MRSVERVEEMKELFLGSVFARDELNVVDEEHIALISIMVPKQIHSIVAYGADQIIEEGLA